MSYWVALWWHPTLWWHLLHVAFQSQVPGANESRLLHMLYPSQVMLGKEGRTAVTDAIKVRRGKWPDEILLSSKFYWSNWHKIWHKTWPTSVSSIGSGDNAQFLPQVPSLLVIKFYWSNWHKIWHKTWLILKCSESVSTIVHVSPSVNWQIVIVTM